MFKIINYSIYLKVHSFAGWCVNFPVGESCFYLGLSPHTLVLKQRDAISWRCASDKRIPAEAPTGDEERVRKWNKQVNETHAHIRNPTVRLHTPLDTPTVKGWIWFIAAISRYIPNLQIIYYYSFLRPNDSFFFVTQTRNGITYISEELLMCRSQKALIICPMIGGRDCVFVANADGQNERVRVSWI